MTSSSIKLEDFDSVLGAMDVASAIETLRELAKSSLALPDKSIYLQVCSQLALAEAMNQQFAEAHETLDEAEKLLEPEYSLARARILLERGRVYHQFSLFGTQNQDEVLKAQEKADSFFKISFDEANKNHFDYHTVNAAHMLAIIVPSVLDKITWNTRALDLAENTSDQKCKSWIPALLNNLGHNYLAAQQYDKALVIFKKSRVLQEQQGLPAHIRLSTWTIAHTLRLMGNIDEALNLLYGLAHEFEAMIKSNSLDVPQEVLHSTRGMLYEDMAESLLHKAKEASQLAYDDLSKTPWIHLPEYKGRLKRLLEIKNGIPS